ncbi:hypothetical protein ACN47E_002808 [Coniothyrium glycines]
MEKRKRLDRGNFLRQVTYGCHAPKERLPMLSWTQPGRQHEERFIREPTSWWHRLQHLRTMDETPRHGRPARSLYPVYSGMNAHLTEAQYDTAHELLRMHVKTATVRLAQFDKFVREFHQPLELQVKGLTKQYKEGEFFEQIDDFIALMEQKLLKRNQERSANRPGLAPTPAASTPAASTSGKGRAEADSLQSAIQPPSARPRRMSNAGQEPSGDATMPHSSPTKGSRIPLTLRGKRSPQPGFMQQTPTKTRQLRAGDSIRPAATASSDAMSYDHDGLIPNIGFEDDLIVNDAPVSSGSRIAAPGPQDASSDDATPSRPRQSTPQTSPVTQADHTDAETGSSTTAESFPLFVRDEENQNWLPIDQLTNPAAKMITDYLADAKLYHKDRYTSMCARPRLEVDGAEDRPCSCSHCQITSRNRWMCNTNAQKFTACDKCLDYQIEPCGRVIDDPTCEGQFAIGFVPLPAELRLGIAWNELAFWLRPDDPAWTKMIQRPKGGFSKPGKQSRIPVPTTNLRRSGRNAPSS